jgi:hypothetical protein
MAREAMTREAEIEKWLQDERRQKGRWPEKRVTTEAEIEKWWQDER